MKPRPVVGVGGLVLYRQQVLLVQHNYGEHEGRWLLPGGHVDQAENLDRAAEREVREETGIEARAQGIVAVRGLIRPDQAIEVYLVFLMEYLSGELQCDPREIRDVNYFRLEEAETHPLVTPLARSIVCDVMQGNYQMFALQTDFPSNGFHYRVYR